MTANTAAAPIRSTGKSMKATRLMTGLSHGGGVNADAHKIDRNHGSKTKEGDEPNHRDQQRECAPEKIDSALCKGRADASDRHAANFP
jgi:hypothetical protein